MKILQINTADTKGGAGKVAYQLKNGLNQKGHQASMIVSKKYSSDDDVVLIRPYNNLHQRILKKLSYWLADDLDFYSSNQILQNPRLKNADIVHCHNLHTYYFNLSTLEKISKIKPVVWTFHDMWPITAHCAHSFGDNVKNGFFVCPSLDIPIPIAWHNEKYLESKKRKIYENSNFHIVVPSLWLKNKVEKSLLALKPISLIYNGIDTSIFKPLDKQECRQELGLPQDKKIILFLAKRGQSNPWKGGSYAESALNEVANRQDLFILDIGGDRNETVGNRKFISFVNDEKIVAKYYSAADILLYPSIADNCPLVALEAQACGLPIVAFKTGGIPEIIDNKETGYIAEYKDIKDLIFGIKYCLGPEKGSGPFSDTEKGPDPFLLMSPKAAQNALTKFSLDMMVDKYLELYSSLLIK